MPNADFLQTEWDAAVAADCRRIVQAALEEDLGGQADWTTVAVVPVEATGRAAIVARASGVIAGLPAVAIVLEELCSSLACSLHVQDGASVSAGAVVASLAGPARDLLTAERTLLNLLGHLSGIATLTSRYVQAVRGTRACIYDTRKTTPGYRRLEKYAVRQGGGWNHRSGLHDAILIKDNHLALRTGLRSGASPADAVLAARDFLASGGAGPASRLLPIEVEVDTLAQLEAVLPAAPDLVLLDNMSVDELRQAAALRNASYPGVVLEASGGIDLATAPAVAATGVDRLSVGALTHSAPALDLALDWET